MTTCRLTTAAVILALGAMIAVAGSARAAEGRIGVELNKLEPLASACRAYVVLTNTAGTAFRDLKLDLVIFDTDGIVARRVAVQGGPIPDGKTSLKVFDIDGVQCAKISRFLLNGVMTCQAQDGKRDDCVGLIDPSSRAPAPLIK
ncbi:Tat pathway signal sequence domain protein [Thalassospiraceae bacterium LMO-SO8]|nr:Tat pathway signal sequence domain protein [Alphaproteobacteria bacterium LMO-S08]WND75213.1 Tat pathway signal sequence domain protein [Thalassospiraceae bacterium LMO-SO8]